MKAFKTIFILCPLSILATTLMLACAPKYEPEPDCNFVQNVYGERISWKRNIPITMYIHESVPIKYHDAILASFKTWEISAGRKLFVSGGVVGGKLDPRQDGSSVIYWMDTWEATRSNEQGRTSIYWVGDEIKEADIRVNEFNFDFYWNSTSQKNEVNVESLMIHELGHVLGLKHNDHNTSVMATYLASATTRNIISTFDMQSISCEY